MLAQWSQKSSLAAELCCGGDFDAAMRLLNRQLGITNFAPLKPYMLQLFRGAQLSVPGVCSVPSLVAYLNRTWDSEAPRSAPQSPATIYNLEALEEEVKKGYKFVTAGKFSDALGSFTSMLHQIPLLVVETRKEVDDVKELIGIAREYLIALRCEIKRKECKDDLQRSAELAAYFTHCKLENVHLVLGLRSAMNVFFKLKNFATCATFCRRLIELNPGPKASPLYETSQDFCSWLSKRDWHWLNVRSLQKMPFRLIMIPGIHSTSAVSPLHRFSEEVNLWSVPIQVPASSQTVKERSVHWGISPRSVQMLLD